MEDDGGLSSESEDSDDEEEFFDARDTTLPSQSEIPQISTPDIPSPEESSAPGPRKKSTLDTPDLNISMNSPATPVPGDVATPMPSAVTTEATPKPGGEFSTPTTTPGKFNPRTFVRKLSGLTGGGSASSSPTLSGQAPLPSPKEPTGRQRKLFGRNKSYTSGYSSSSGGENTISGVSTPTTPSIVTGVRDNKRGDSYYEYKNEHDIIGIVMLEVQGANHLPKWANSEFS